MSECEQSAEVSTGVALLAVTAWTVITFLAGMFIGALWIAGACGGQR